MATVNAVNRPQGQTRGGVAAILKYTMQEHKTECEGRHLVSGINCMPECCYTEFIGTKLQHGKCSGKMYYHFVQSFSPDENITPDKAHEIAIRFASEQWRGYECIVATHTDTPHIHSHVIVNSVSFESGMKYHCAKETLTQLRNASDDLCREYGLSICQPKPDAVESYGQAEYHTAMRGESWKMKLALDIDNAMKYAVSKEQFSEFMESDGYQVKWTDSRKSITYADKDGHACRDYRLHEKKYLKERMENEFRIRKEIIAGGIESSASYDTQDEFSESRRSTAYDDADRIELAGTYTSGGADWLDRDTASGIGRQSDDGAAVGRNDGRAGQNVAGAASRENGQIRVTSDGDSTDGQKFAGNVGETGERGFESNRTADEDSDAGNGRTGWESERQFLIQYLESGGTNEPEHEAESVDIADTDSGDYHPGVDTLLFAEGLIMLFGNDFDSLTPEEKRKRIEEKQAEQNSKAFSEICDMLIRKFNIENVEDENYRHGYDRGLVM